MEMQNLYAHYDAEADIAWFVLPGWEGEKVVSDEEPFGLRDVREDSGETVGLEFWKASERLPAALLAALPRPRVDAAR
jgi:uncharacterized protein YuzE